MSETPELELNLARAEQALRDAKTQMRAFNRVGKLDEQERRVLALLGEAWNAFALTTLQHPSEREEFMRAIHAAQVIVMARPTQRAHPDFFSDAPARVVVVEP